MAEISRDLMTVFATEPGDPEPLPGTEFEAAGAPEVSPAIRQIVQLLLRRPEYAQPTLEWLQQREAAIARATLKELHRPEQLNELLKRQGYTDEQIRLFWES